LEAAGFATATAFVDADESGLVTNIGLDPIAAAERE
jgi:hypothetical protein